MSVAISFVVPAFNESRFIESCLSSIVERINKFGLDAEIIVVDNGSTDNTAELAQRYDCDLYSISRGRISTARNYGLAKAKNELIAFIDGDVSLTDQWFESLMSSSLFRDAPQNFLSGRQCIVPPDGTRIERYWFANLTDKYLGGANIVTTKKAMTSLNGFNEDLETGEDYDLCLRAIEHPAVNYSPDEKLLAIHLGFPQDFRNFIRRERWHGKGDVQQFLPALRSPVVLISILYVVALVVVLFTAVFGLYKEALMVLALFLTLNLFLTCVRFSKASFKALLFNSLLHPFYFVARFSSFFSGR